MIPVTMPAESPSSPDQMPRCCSLRVTTHLPAHPTSPGLARRRLRAFLRHSPQAASLLDDALLVVSELVTNAVLHGCGPINLTLARTAPGAESPVLLIEVRNAGTMAGTPPGGHGSTAEESGRGLAIVEALCTQVGIRTHAGFTTVRAEFRPT